jgi:hypothetical protein
MWDRTSALIGTDSSDDLTTAHIFKLAHTATSAWAKREERQAIFQAVADGNTAINVKCWCKAVTRAAAATTVVAAAAVTAPGAAASVALSRYRAGAKGTECQERQHSVDHPAQDQRFSSGLQVRSNKQGDMASIKFICLRRFFHMGRVSVIRTYRTTITTNYRPNKKRFYPLARSIGHSAVWRCIAMGCSRSCAILLQNVLIHMHYASSMSERIACTDNFPQEQAG